MFGGWWGNCFINNKKGYNSKWAAAARLPCLFAVFKWELEDEITGVNSWEKLVQVASETHVG